MFQLHTYCTVCKIYVMPLGGPSWVNVWDLACGLKKRKRQNSKSTEQVRTQDSLEYHTVSLDCTEEESFTVSSQKLLKHLKNRSIRRKPLSMKGMMKICCYFGCEFSDFFNYCNIF